MSTLNFEQIMALADDEAPLYCKLRGQINPQPARIYLYMDGSVCADYSVEIGNGRPADEWNGVTLTWNITPFLSGNKIIELLTEDETIVELLGRVYDGHDREWDGSNWVGTLTNDAQDAHDRLVRIFDEIDGDVEVWSVEDWLFSSCSLRDNWPVENTLAKAVNAAEDSILNSDSNIVLNGDIKEVLLEYALDYAQRGKPGLGETHLSALLEHGMITQEDADEYRECCMEDLV